MSSIYKALKGEKGVKKESHRANRQRVLLISSRGVTFRHRHLISDLSALLPQARKEPKLDTKRTLYELNEVAEMYNCNNVMFFEARKHTDLYLWLSKPPNGPTIKFFVQNMHTMDELNFTGNCLRGSRPILSFDKAFDKEPRYRLMKEMFTQQFGVPPRARKSKPFVDHVMTFSVVDDKVWIRNYQITEPEQNQEEGDEENEIDLVEIGPRLVLTPILVLEGSFGGPKIYENKQYISPNVARAQTKMLEAKKARKRQDAADIRKHRLAEQTLEADPLANDFLFKDAEDLE